MTFADPKSKIDFFLRFFNRKNSYFLRLLIVTSEKIKQLSDIEFISPEVIPL